MIPPINFRSLLLAALSLVTPLSSLAADGDAGWGSPGQGYSIAGTTFHLGGYAEAGYRNLKQTKPEAGLDSLSVFLWSEGEVPWSFFGELELEDALLLRPGDITVDEAYPALERFHVDYTFSDALQLRAGKFLTPIGRWNVIHAAPLTWTTSRPLVTEKTFPGNATGVMALGKYPIGGQALEWSVYGSFGEELFPKPGLDTFEEAYGVRLDYDFGAALRFGISLAQFEQRHEEDYKTLYGFDLLYTWRRVELMGEWALRTHDFGESKADEKGFYVQAAIPVHKELFAVARFETLDPVGQGDNFHLHLLGLNWRWRESCVIKAEYNRLIEEASGAEEGFRASISFLF